MEMQRIRKKTKGRDGFTFVELICIIAIFEILVALAVPSYRGVQDKSARQVAVLDARSNYALEKIQQEILDAGLILSSETQDYSYDKDRDSAYWKSEMSGIQYKTVYPGSGGKGEIENSSGNQSAPMVQ